MLEESIVKELGKHVLSVKGKSIRIQKLSGLTNVTYAVYVDHTPLYIFKVFSDGFDREAQNKLINQLVGLKLAPNIIHAEKIYRIQEFLQNTQHPNQ